MPNAAPGAATILDYSEMRRPSINNSCNKVIVIKLDKLYYSESKLFNLKHKLCNNNMPSRSGLAGEFIGHASNELTSHT